MKKRLAAAVLMAAASVGVSRAEDILTLNTLNLQILAAFGRNDQQQHTPNQQQQQRSNPQTQAPVHHEQPRQEPVRHEEPRHEQPVRREEPRHEPVRREEPRHEQPVRREEPRQEPVRREQPKQEPVHREQPRQEPVRREEPRHEPVRREQPKQEPIHREKPHQEPVTRREPIHREPHRQDPPQKRPPVIVQPKTGRPERLIPTPRPVDHGHLLDPKRHGDGHAIVPPTSRDGRPLGERPWADARGRHRPPSRDHIAVINDRFVHGNIVDLQNRWRHDDHGYHWHDWNGHHVCHHYDDHGYHWWGFYVGPNYFWTRYYADRYWWYDPFWGRWVYLYDGRWWWQDPYAPAVVYVVIDNDYYRYRNESGTVIVTPDPTPPPSDPNAAAPEAKEAVYSLDGTRSIQIVGDRRDAYLYDLTVEDADAPEARGRWLAAGVKTAKFAYEEKTGTGQVVRQIELAFEDPATKAVIDPQGERKVIVSGEEREAVVYNLRSDEDPGAVLATGVVEVRFITENKKDSSGRNVQRLKWISLSRRDAAGNESVELFDGDGAAYLQTGQADSPDASATARLVHSASFKALESGAPNW